MGALLRERHLDHAEATAATLAQVVEQGANDAADAVDNRSPQSGSATATAAANPAAPPTDVPVSEPPVGHEIVAFPSRDFVDAGGFAGDEIVVKDYVHLGIAAATPRGLLVPNVKDADQLSLLELARALQALTETAREGRTSPADMADGTITITNVGTFGVDNGTPILNPGESAILCFGVVRATPWVVDGEVVVRQVTQLSLSFDHRNVDGQLGSQFLSDIARVLAEPELALVWG